MARAADVLSRIWARLPEQVLGYPPLASGAAGVPPTRTRKRLFPVLFSSRALSGPLVKAAGEMPDAHATAAMNELRARTDVLVALVPWHRALVAAYRAYCRTRKHAFLGEDSGAKLLPHALSLASRHGEPADSSALIEAEARIAALAASQARLTKQELDRALGEHRVELQARLDDRWSARTTPATADPPSDSGVKALAARFELARGDEPDLDGPPELLAELWDRILLDPVIDVMPPGALGLTSADEPGKPLLDGPAGDLPLDRSIRSRLTRLLHGEAGEVLEHPRIALERAIDASAHPFGLGTATGRATLALGAHLGWVLVDPKQARHPGERAIARLWLRHGTVESIERRDGDRFARAQAFISRARDEFLRRLWGRLLRAEVVGEPIGSPLDAWREIAGAVGSVRRRVRSLIPPGPKPQPRPGPGRGDVGGIDVERLDLDLGRGVIWHRVEMVVSFNTDGGDVAAYLAAVANADDPATLAAHERRWEEWCTALVAAPSDDPAFAIPLDDLPTFSMVRAHLRALRPTTDGAP